MTSRYITLLIIYLFGLCLNSYSMVHKPNNTGDFLLDSKNVLLLSSDGGGGQTAVVRAFKAYFKDTNFTVINSVNFFKKLDTLRTITFGAANGESLYNYLLVRKYYKSINLLYDKFGAHYMAGKSDKGAAILTEYLKKNPADLVVSIVPAYTKAILEATHRCNIPTIIVPPDLDGSLYVAGLNYPSYDHFLYCLTFDNDLMRQKIKDAHIAEDKIIVSGFPVHPDFLKKQDKNAIKSKFNIPVHKPVIMLMNGARGNSTCVSLVEQLSHLSIPCHLLVCLGQAEHLRPAIEEIALPSHISTSIFGFTTAIPELTKISKTLVTKPGTVSFSEGIHAEVPMILIDTEKEPIAWEGLNPHILQQQGFGDVLTSFDHIEELVTKHLKDKKYRKQVKANLREFKKEHFGTNFEKAAQYLFAKNKAEKTK